MKIVIGRNPMDVKIFDDEGRHLSEFKIAGLQVNLEGGGIPTAELKLELWDNCELVVADFDLNAAADLAMREAVRHVTEYPRSSIIDS